MSRAFRWLAIAGVAACGDGRGGNSSTGTTDGPPMLDLGHERFEVVGNPLSEPGQGRYLCFVLDGTSPAGKHVQRGTWSTRRDPVAVHYATLSRLADPLPLG